MPDEDKSNQKQGPLEERVCCAWVGVEPRFLQAFQSYLDLFFQCGFDFKAYCSVKDFFDGFERRKDQLVLSKAGFPYHEERVKILSSGKVQAELVEESSRFLTELRKSDSPNKETPLLFVGKGKKPEIEIAYQTNNGSSLADSNASFFSEYDLPSEFSSMLQQKFPWLNPANIKPGELVQPRAIAWVYADEKEVLWRQSYETDLLESAVLNQERATVNLVEIEHLVGRKKVEDALTKKKYDLIIGDPYLFPSQREKGYSKTMIELILKGAQITFDLYDELQSRFTINPAERLQHWMIKSPLISQDLIEFAVKERYGKTSKELGILTIIYLQGSILDRIVCLHDDFTVFPSTQVSGVNFLRMPFV